MAPHHGNNDKRWRHITEIIEEKLLCHYCSQTISIENGASLFAVPSSAAQYAYTSFSVSSTGKPGVSLFARVYQNNVYTISSLTHNYYVILLLLFI